MAGRWYSCKKETVEQSRSISVSWLRKHDYFCGYRNGGITWKNCYGEESSSIGVIVDVEDDPPYIRVQYTNTRRSTGEKTKCDYKAYLTTTPCNLGGVRYWFLCPLQGCDRRVGTLYCPPGAIYYGCRHCYKLTYDSRNESRLGRPGGLGYSLVLDRKLEELLPIKRWTWQGRPTRKARKYNKLIHQLENQPPVEVMLERMYRGN
ncbi:hypothetical protein ACFL6U_26390 [Planctomycetota bacterium]